MKKQAKKTLKDFNNNQLAEKIKVKLKGGVGGLGFDLSLLK